MWELFSCYRYFTMQNKPVKLYDDLREPIVISGTSVDKLRDLVHFGSDSPVCGVK